jgi:hypothetical protein
MDSILKNYYELQKSQERCLFGVYCLSGMTADHVYQLALVQEKNLEEKIKDLNPYSYYIYALSAHSIRVKQQL